MAPRHLRIYANHATIVDFDDAEVTKAQLNVTLREGEVGVVEYPLNTPAFANIHSLSVFFVSSTSKRTDQPSQVFASERGCRGRGHTIVLHWLQGRHPVIEEGGSQ
jgi:hypothetical protein